MKWKFVLKNKTYKTETIMKRKFYIFYIKGIEFIIQNLSTKNMPDGFSGEFFPTCLFLSERHKRHIHTFLCLYITHSICGLTSPCSMPHSFSTFYALC